MILSPLRLPVPPLVRQELRQFTATLPALHREIISCGRNRSGTPQAMSVDWMMANANSATSSGVSGHSGLGAIAHAAQGSFALKLWGPGGLRTLTLSGVTFP
jgi:hypothetical protein